MSKPIGVKLADDVLNKLDHLTEKHYYWKRNKWINGLLRACLSEFPEESLIEMMMRYNP